ncbi:MAG: histidine kinase, partial [Methanomicrobiales archaeon HGW-Methanomicrobiales-4]
MDQHSEKPDEQTLRERIIGLGTLSHQKSYYPELKRRISDLERFRTLLNETEDAIFLVRVSTRICIDLNRAAVNLTGYSTESLLNIRFEELFAPECKKNFVHYVDTENPVDSDSTHRMEVS